MAKKEKKQKQQGEQKVHGHIAGEEKKAHGEHGQYQSKLGKFSQEQQQQRIKGQQQQGQQQGQKQSGYKSEEESESSKYGKF